MAVLILGLAYKASFLPATFSYEIRVVASRLFQNGRIAGGSVFQLPADYHRQEHSLSCEIASLKMALSALGFNVAESELLAKMDFDSSPKTASSWGDPNLGFVGSINGKMPETGYGVYWDPIARLASAYTLAETAQFDAKKLAEELKNGHPVIAWGFVGSGKRMFWTAPSGRKIDAVQGEHARTVVGYWGSADSPSGFVILDPIYGKLYWKTETLMKNWSAFNRIGIILKNQ